MLAPWATVVTMITLRDFGINPPGAKWKGKGNLVGGIFPAPGDFLATFVLFAPLAALSDIQSAHNTVELFAWAVVLAIYMGAVDPSVPTQNAAGPNPSGQGVHY